MLYDNQVMVVQQILTAIAGHLIAIQAASLNREVYLALHDSSRALGSSDEDKVETILDKLDEQHGDTRNIMDMISMKPLDVSSIDEGDIDEELQKMLHDTSSTTSTNEMLLPVAPTHSICKTNDLLKHELVDNI